MFVKSFEIQNFRNIESEKRNVTSGITAFIAKNGAGKTNRLESIFVASVGKSFKAGKEEEMIAFQKDIARIKVGIEKKEGEEEVEVILTRGQIKMAEEVFQKAQKKKLMVNGVPKRQIDFAGNLLVTVFGPWDVDLITDPPSARRKFLDYVLSQVDREYRRCLLSYEKGVRQRNRILLNIRENNAPRSQLLFWDKLLIKNGDYISRVRDEFIQFIKKTPQIGGKKLSIEYDRSVISEERLEKYKYEEVSAATTLVGPHRDDMVVSQEGNDMAKFASRGENRMAVLWIKAAELEYITIKTGERPVLLLDDVFSELDHVHRKIVMEMATRQQTIMTTADEHFVEEFSDIQKVVL